MRFIRVADGDQTHFCGVQEDATLLKLNTRPRDPSDYLQLYQTARDSGHGVPDAAAALVSRGHSLPWKLDELDVAPRDGAPYLLAPYLPPEVWGAAFTYDFRPGPQSRDDPFIQERRAARPVIFFKATPHRCVGPNDAVGSRGDATHMIPEPELGLLLSSGGEIIGYTAVNDVSSRDLPRANPLYVCYSKTFTRCVSLGPAVVAPESIPDPMNVAVRCRVTRGGQTLWDESGNTGRMYRTLAELIEHLVAHNELLDGTLFATGTALSPPQEMHIVEGDLLEVFVEGIGRLANPVVAV